MLHARVLRQPNRGANLVSLNEDAIRRAAQGEISFVRIHNFVGIVGDDEAAVQRACWLRSIMPNGTACVISIPSRARRPDS